LTSRGEPGGGPGRPGTGFNGVGAVRGQPGAGIVNCEKLPEALWHSQPAV